MCGIIGIVSQKDVSERILDGLKRVEYRGYDSAGIAIVDENRVRRLRAKGKLSSLVGLYRKEPVAGNSGLGHTRWATHGAPSTRNAHPHVIDGVSIVHNGIIENYLELRESERLRDVEFDSQTDSEIIAQLLAIFLKGSNNAVESLRGVIGLLSGAFAFVAINAANPGELLFARCGSSLVFGRDGDGDVYIGSDAQAIAPWCREITFLEDGDYGAIGRDALELYDSSGNPVEREVRSVDPSAVAGKGRHRHFMHKEIFEQPTAVGHTLVPLLFNVAGSDDVLEAGIDLDCCPDWTKVGRVVLSACGTAYYASMIGAHWFELSARLPARAELASEFRMRSPVLFEDDLAIFVSQSGETMDTLECFRYLKSRGLRCISVVNNDTGALARETDATVVTRAGPEIGVASTKAFTTQLAVLYCMALKAGFDRGVITPADYRSSIAGLRSVPSAVSDLLHGESDYIELGEELADAKYCMFLGRGLLYPIALEGALKLKEISYISAEGYAAGEMKHGPISLIGDETPAVILLPDDPVLLSKMTSNVSEIVARNGKTVVVGGKDAVDKVRSRVDVWRSLTIPVCGEGVSPILHAVAMQLLAYHTANAKGTDIDQPRNLAKSVTVE